jgi:hypothetical protein
MMASSANAASQVGHKGAPDRGSVEREATFHLGRKDPRNTCCARTTLFFELDLRLAEGLSPQSINRVSRAMGF